MKNYILFVDDEPSILSAIKRVFRKSSHNILTADTVEKALEIIRTTPISVLVSDYTMPDRTGAELLAAAKQIRPNMTRIILSGNGDQEATIQSINKGAASRFLAKPWDDQQLTIEIGEAVLEWEATRYLHLEKKLLNQVAFNESLITIEPESDERKHAVVYFGIRDFESLQQRLGQNKVQEFLQFITPLDKKHPECLALDVLADNQFCSLLSIENGSEDLEFQRV